MQRLLDVFVSIPCYAFMQSGYIAKPTATVFSLVFLLRKLLFYKNNKCRERMVELWQGIQVLIKVTKLKLLSQFNKIIIWEIILQPCNTNLVFSRKVCYLIFYAIPEHFPKYVSCFQLFVIYFEFKNFIAVISCSLRFLYIHSICQSHFVAATCFLITFHNKTSSNQFNVVFDVWFQWRSPCANTHFPHIKCRSRRSGVYIFYRCRLWLFLVVLQLCAKRLRRSHQKQVVKYQRHCIDR